MLSPVIPSAVGKQQVHILHQSENQMHPNTNKISQRQQKIERNSEKKTYLVSKSVRRSTDTSPVEASDKINYEALYVRLLGSFTTS
jgi:hypothetical protein